MEQLVIVGLLVLLPLLWTAGRVQRRRALREWRFVLSPSLREALEADTRRFDEDGRAEELFYLGAAESRTRRPELAPSLLGGWAGSIGRLRRSAGWLLQAASAVLDRVAAVAPIDPAPWQFRGRELRAAGALGVAVHHLLVSPLERARLRIALLRIGIGHAGAAARASGLRLAGDVADGRRWDVFERRREDFRTVTDGVRETFEAAALSAAALRVETPSASSPRPQLVYDSAEAPRVSGTRAPPARLRRLLWECEAYSVDIELTPGAGRAVVVVGQLAGRGWPPDAVAEVPVVVHGQEGSSEVTTNRLGEFVVEVHCPFRVDLTLGSRNLELQLPSPVVERARRVGEP